MSLQPLPNTPFWKEPRLCLAGVDDPRPLLPLARATLETHFAQADAKTSDAGAHVGAFRHRVRGIWVGPGVAARWVFQGLR